MCSRVIFSYIEYPRSICTNGLSLLTGSVILAMISAIFAAVVLAIFLFYPRKILHYGIEKMESSVEKERRMTLVLTLHTTK